MDRQQKRYLRGQAEKEKLRRRKELKSPSAAPTAEDDLDRDVDHSDAGIVFSVSSGRCRVVREGRELDCLIPPGIAVRQKSALAVGDRVMVGDDGRVSEILARRSVLARPDPLNKHVQRLIAANIDIVIHVVSVKAPPLRPRLIDRYLIAIQRGGAEPALCVNKVDLLEPAERVAEMEKLTVYRELGVPVVPCSTKTGEGLETLRELVQGKTAALVGHSGVGKSSILNAIDKELQLAINELHRRGTGRHTTSSSTLYDFGDGTYLIDTPGIREFGLWDLDRDSLRDYFPEFAEPAQSCRFNDCTHTHEPGCHVKDLVEAGTMNRARYDTYLRLYEDLGTQP
ncbi:MAG TPA: ribosome small subunit-dependent GTPase A [Thermoanaerobaculia bacterium]|nr:ribosome small subunit-dependent GTPase A [Thermoanaerobaculia bacterium]